MSVCESVGRRINVCESVGQNGQRGELCAQGYSAFLVQEKGGGGGGSLECEESKVIKCQEARSSPTHLSERRGAGRLQTLRQQRKGHQVW